LKSSGQEGIQDLRDRRETRLKGQKGTKTDGTTENKDKEKLRIINQRYKHRDVTAFKISMHIFTFNNFIGL